MGPSSMSINNILMGLLRIYYNLKIQTHICFTESFWLIRKRNCISIESINAAAIKWNRGSNSAAPSLVLATYTSWVSHCKMMRPLYALAVKSTSEFFLKILVGSRTLVSKKQKTTFAMLIFLVSSLYGSLEKNMHYFCKNHWPNLSQKPQSKLPSSLKKVVGNILFCAQKATLWTVCRPWPASRLS